MNFDENSANKFIDSMLGVDYGYEVLLVSLIDSIDGNFPCFREVILYILEYLS